MGDCYQDPIIFPANSSSDLFWKKYSLRWEIATKEHSGQARPKQLYWPQDVTVGVLLKIVPTQSKIR